MASGSWNWSGANSWSAGRIEWSSKSNGSSANSSNVTVKLYGRRSDGGTSYNASASNFSITINGSTSRRTSGITIAGTNWTLIHSYTRTVGHNSDGSKSITISGGGNITGTTFNINSSSRSITLDKIPRYATITTWKNTAVTQTTATFNWAANAACDVVQYSLNGGSWTNTSGTTFTVSGLTPNTSYAVKIKVRRTDSKLTTESSVVNIKTQPITTISNSSLAFNIGQNLSLAFANYNIKDAYLKVDVETPSGSWTNISSLNATITTSTSSLALNLSSIASTLYSNCPSKNTVRVRITVGSIIDDKDFYNYYYATGTVTNSAPTFSAFAIANTNANVTTMLGNASYFIQTYGSVRAQISTANKAVAKNYASISKYVATITNSSGNVLSTLSAAYSSTAQVNITFSYTFASTGTYYVSVRAIDSRGNSSNTIRQTIYVLPYHLPILSISLARVNDYEKEVTLSLAATYSRVLLSSVAKNDSVTIQYRYKEAGTSSWTSYTTLPASSTTTSGNDATIRITKDATSPLLTLPSETSYDFQFRVIDEVRTVTQDITLPQGIPIMVEGDNGHIGIGMIPDWDNDNLLQVASDIVATDPLGIQKALLNELSKIITPSNTEPSDQSLNYIWLKTEE